MKYINRTIATIAILALSGCAGEMGGVEKAEISKNDILALEYECKGGNSTACMKASRHYLDTHVPRSVEYAEIGCEQGQNRSSELCCWTAGMLYSGGVYGIQKNYYKSAMYLEKACETRYVLKMDKNRGFYR